VVVVAAMVVAVAVAVVKAVRAAEILIPLRDCK
jgi:hypothetical protein